MVPEKVNNICKSPVILRAESWLIKTWKLPIDFPSTDVAER